MICVIQWHYSVSEYIKFALINLGRTGVSSPAFFGPTSVRGIDQLTGAEYASGIPNDLPATSRQLSVLCSVPMGCYGSVSGRI